MKLAIVLVVMSLTTVNAHADGEDHPTELKAFGVDSPLTAAASARAGSSPSLTNATKPPSTLLYFAAGSGVVAVSATVLGLTNFFTRQGGVEGHTRNPTMNRRGNFGLAMLGVGLASGAAAAYLYREHRRRAKTSVVPTAAGDSIGLAWTGSF